MDLDYKKFKDNDELNPNNFDMVINPEDIPANIKLVNSSQLQFQLQKLMPLSKKIHFKYETKTQNLSSGNNLFLSTKMKINNVMVKFI